MATMVGMLRQGTMLGRLWLARGLSPAVEKHTNATVERRRHVRHAESSQLGLEPTLELGARVTASTRGEMLLEITTIAVAELAIEVLGDEPECVVATQDGAVRHCDSVVFAH
jgi:hypothetical protein